VTKLGKVNQSVLKIEKVWPKKQRMKAKERKLLIDHMEGGRGFRNSFDLLQLKKVDIEN